MQHIYSFTDIFRNVDYQRNNQQDTTVFQQQLCIRTEEKEQI